MKDTTELAYKTRLVNADTRWKRLLDVQRPYRWNLQRLDLKNVLDVGCGIGRNLQNLKRIGVRAIGVDHNEHSIDEAKSRGFEALTSEQFLKAYTNNQPAFDAILLSHVLEHMQAAEATQVIKDYLPYLKPGGLVVSITPQEAGYKTDPTHINFVDLSSIQQMMEEAALTFENGYSFPFPRWVGKIFTYNEFVAVGRK